VHTGDEEDDACFGHRGESMVTEAAGAWSADTCRLRIDWLDATTGMATDELQVETVSREGFGRCPLVSFASEVLSLHRCCGALV